MDFRTDRPVFRFAPSPNGLLHLGHAYSALLNRQLADHYGGRLLLRIEDIDTVRCTPEREAQLIEDLDWLGIAFDGPVIRQSERFALYQERIEALLDAGIAYRSALSRGDIARIVEACESRGDEWPRDPDGSPLFPGRAFEDPELDVEQPHAIRLDMKAALNHLDLDDGAVEWEEIGGDTSPHHGLQSADVSQWGDFVLARKDTPTSYHVAVVVDDSLQGVTHVVRGNDLYQATAAHGLLQQLFGMPQPLYHHHHLIVDESKRRKLSKSHGDTSLLSLRQAGATPEDIRLWVGLAPA